MRTRVGLAVGAAALVVVGCGGDDDTATVEDPADEATSEADEAASEAAEAGAGLTDEPTDEPADEPAGAPADEPTDDGSSGGANQATITVGDETFEFEWETTSIQLCDPDFFGGFVAIAATTADQPSFDVELAEPGTPGFEDRSPRIEVSAGGDGQHWTADPQETIGTTYDSWPAMVDSFELDGNRASGTATFVGSTPIGEEPVGVPGTFEVTCTG